MLRRRLCVVPRVAPFVRFGSHGPTTHDQSAAFSRPLTVEESMALEDQKNRTVSAIVPGKMFMRHFVMAEQSTVSIVNRALSLVASLGFIAWGVWFSDYGITTISAVHVSIGVSLAAWFILHTHMLWLLPVFLGLTTLQILFN